MNQKMAIEIERTGIITILKIQHKTLPSGINIIFCFLIT